MIEAMAQSRRNFCRRNCVHATERGGCTVGARPERVGPQFPRRGGAYYVGRIRCERGEWLDERRW